MARKIGKTLRRSAAVVLALALAFSGFASVWAAPPEDIPDKTAAVTKVLEVPAGTTIPTATFSFVAELQGAGGPATLTIPDIEIDGTETAVTANNVTTVKEQTEDFIKDIDLDNFTGGVGEYIYTITESAAVYTAVPDTTVYTYESKAVYEIHIYVDEDGSRDLYIAYVVAWRTVDDTGTDITDEKVDPSPGDNVNTFSHMDFTNNYVKTESPDEEDPAPVDYELFLVSKTVANTSDSTYFPFSVTVVNPDFPIPDGEPGGLPEYYKAYVMAEGDVINIAAENKGGNDGNGDYYTFRVGIPETIYLKHGQSLVFPATPVGATWTAAELLGDDDAYEDYTAKADVTTAGTKTVPYVTASKGETLTVSAPVGEGGNAADFTNDKAFILPMGISVDNLPYIGLILLALAGLAAYVAVKTRRRKLQTNNA
jgi:hypothetical protein